MVDKVEPTSTSPDWPAQATDTIVSVVGQVRDKTTGPVITVARGIVYGTLAAIAGVVALVLACILLIRVLAIPVEEVTGSTDRIWIVYLGLGAVMTVVGYVLWRKAWRAPVSG